MKAARKPPGRPSSGVVTSQGNRRAPRVDRLGFSSVLNWKRVLLCIFALAVSVPPSLAQKVGITSTGAYRKAGKFPERVYSSVLDSKSTVAEEMCFPWAVSEGRATTVSVGRLKIPQKAKDEYQKACDASNQGKLAEAEQRARGAIAKFQNYPAGWVLLGLILEGQEKSQEARDACSHASLIDASYLPAYLCSAEVSVRDRNWDQVLNLADKALALNSKDDLYGYYYRARAFFHMNNLVEAQKSALQALDADVNHDEPSLCLLLAKIYEREGDNANAIAQLEQLLKHPVDRQREDAARQLLAELQSRPPVKSTH